MALNWQGTWSPYTTYQIEDVVFYLTASYVALDINTNVAPTQNNLGSYWTPFAVGARGPQGPQGATGAASTVPGATGATGATGAAGQGFTWRNAYSSLNTYNAYDCVSYGGSSYICIANGVIGVAPGTDISKWNTLVQTSGSGVSSFNGRSGAVVPTSGDYSYEEISGTPAPSLPLTGGILSGDTAMATGSAVYFNGSLTDFNWGIAVAPTDNSGWFTTSHSTNTLKIVHGLGTNDGFAIGGTGSIAFLEIDHEGTVYLSQDAHIAGALVVGNSLQAVNTFIQGQIHLSENLYDMDSQPGTVGQVLTSVNGGTLWANPTPIPAGSETGGLQYNAGSGIMGGTIGITTDGENTITSTAVSGTMVLTNNSLSISTSGNTVVVNSGALDLSGSNAHIRPNSDVAGTVVLLSGQTSVNHPFSVSYGSAPIVVVTAAAGAWDTFTKFWVGTSTGSFTLFVDHAPSGNYTFNYIVMGS